MNQNDSYVKMDLRILNLIDLGETKGIKLGMNPIIRIMKSGKTLEDLFVNFGKIDGVSSIINNKIQNILNNISKAEFDFLKNQESFYRLLLIENGLTDTIVRNFLLPSDLRFSDLEGLDYIKFKALTGGKEKLALFHKIMTAHNSYVDRIKGHTVNLMVETNQENIQTVVNLTVETNQESIQTNNTFSESIEEKAIIVFDRMSDEESITSWIKMLEADEDSAMRTLFRLKHQGMVDIDGRLIKKRTIGIDEFIEGQKNVRTRDILRARLSGRSVRVLAEEHKISHQYVSQILDKALSKIPVTHISGVGNHAYLFQNFKLDLNFFKNILMQDERIYYFIKEKCFKGERARRETYDFLTSEQKKRLLYVESLVEDSNGRPVVLSKQNLVEKYFILFGGEIKHIESHHASYLEFLAMELRDRNEEIHACALSVRNFENLVSRAPYCIQSDKRKVRHFRSSHIMDEKPVIEDLFKLDDGIYSTKLVFQKNESYFNSLDIRNYYELHNLLRYHLTIDSIEMRRMPDFSINISDKFEWMLKLISVLEPITVVEFAQYLENNYGLHAASSRSLILAELSDHIDSQKRLTCTISRLNVEEKAFIKALMVEDIYSIAELEKSHHEISNFRQKYLNNLVLNDLGYVVSGSFVLRKKIGRAERYFRRLVLKQDYFKVDKSPLQNSQSFLKVLSDLQKSYELLRIEENLYMKLSVLEKIGFSKEDILDFQNQVVSFFMNRQYYSMKNIHGEMQHELLELGFDDIFYERICRESEGVGYIPLGSGDIFYRSKNKKNLTDFLKDEVEEGIEVSELISLIKEKYGVSLDTRKVIEKLKGAGYHYIIETGSLHSDKNVFFERLYERSFK